MLVYTLWSYYWLSCVRLSGGKVGDRLPKSRGTSLQSQGRVGVGPRSDCVRRRELVVSCCRRLFDAGFWPRRCWTLSPTLGRAVDCQCSDVIVPLLDAVVVAVELSVHWRCLRLRRSTCNRRWHADAFANCFAAVLATRTYCLVSRYVSFVLCWLFIVYLLCCRHYCWVNLAVCFCGVAVTVSHCVIVSR